MIPSQHSLDLDLQYSLDPNQPWHRGEHLLTDHLAQLTESMARVLEAEQSITVRQSIEPQKFIDQLKLTLPSHPTNLEDVLQQLEEIMLAAPLTTGPAFFNQLFGGRDPSSIFGEIFASLGNHSLYTYKLAGPFVLMEDILIQKLGSLAGISTPERRCGGIFTPGGSISNLVAMLCARDHVNRTWRENGGIKAKIYTSAEAHYSIRKGAGVVGIGRDQVEAIPCDDFGRMSPALLQKKLKEDQERGRIPMMVVATSGTTVRGAFDHLDDLAQVCEDEEVWLHVDAAFGGAALLSATLRDLMKGIQRANSLTWDAHKVMGVPLTCSVLLTRDEHACSSTLQETASYLFQKDDDHLNPGTRSLQCGRRNDILKLWSSWNFHGDWGWARRVERSRALALCLADELERRPRFTLVEPPPYLTVCFEVLNSDDEVLSSSKICDQLQHEQLALVGHATCRSREVIRAAIINPSLTSADLIRLLDHIEHITS